LTHLTETLSGKDRGVIYSASELQVWGLYFATRKVKEPYVPPTLTPDKKSSSRCLNQQGVRLLPYLDRVSLSMSEIVYRAISGGEKAHSLMSVAWAAHSAQRTGSQIPIVCFNPSVDRAAPGDIRPLVSALLRTAQNACVRVEGWRGQDDSSLPAPLPSAKHSPDSLTACHGDRHFPINKQVIRTPARVPLVKFENIVRLPFRSTCGVEYSRRRRVVGEN
jgi:hypothetical protein